MSTCFYKYNSILLEGTFPPQWRQSLVVLIPKPGGTGVQPISLMSCFLKLGKNDLHMLVMIC